jgi:hypothetical protein
MATEERKDNKKPFKGVSETQRMRQDINKTMNIG